MSARAQGTALFKSGRYAAAVGAYNAAVLKAESDAERLTLRSNLGLCYLKLSEPVKAAKELKEGLGLHVACYSNPGLAAKVAARLMQACDILDDVPGYRSALTYCRFYLAVPGVLVPSGLTLPPPPDTESVSKLLMTIGSATGDAGLASVREALAQVPGESLDGNRIHALILSIHVASLKACTEWGLSLVKAVLDSGVPVDAPSENGRTALMIASNTARKDFVEMLLAAGADPFATDGEGFSALHTALVDLSDHPSGDLCEIVRTLASRGVAIDAIHCKGLTPLMYCARHGGEKGLALAEVLLDCKASTRIRSSLMHGFSAYDFAVRLHGRDSAIASLLRQHAEGYSRESRLTCRQSDLTIAFHRFLDETLRGSTEADSNSLGSTEDAGIEGADSSVRGPESTAWPMQERRVRMLATAAGMSEADVFSVTARSDGSIPNPLEDIWKGLSKSLPRALTTRYSSSTADDEETANELRLLVGLRAWRWKARTPLEAQLATTELLVRHDAQPSCWFDSFDRRNCYVPAHVYQDYVDLVQAPLQFVFARAVPSDDALATLGLCGPICELGAGTGYWSALLRARGVDCVCFSETTENSTAANRMVFTHVAAGGVEMVADYAKTHTLLLVWPNFHDDQLGKPGQSAMREEASSLFGESVEAEEWDVSALRRFTEAGGQTLAHVGELSEGGMRTTSSAFKVALRKAFEKDVTVRLPNWPCAADELTIWRRRGAEVPGETASGVLDVRMELCDLEAPQWAKPPRAQGPVVNPSTSAFGLSAGFD